MPEEKMKKKTWEDYSKEASMLVSWGERIPEKSYPDPQKAIGLILIDILKELKKFNKKKWKI